MKRIALVVSCLALLMALSAAAFAEPVPKDIQALYAKFGAATEKKDLAALGKLVTPDFVVVTEKGKTQTLEQVKQTLQFQLAILQNLRSKYTVAKATVKGKTASATTQSTMSGEIKNAKTNVVQKVKVTAKSQDTLLKTAEGWKLKKLVVLAQTATIDGKPIQGM